MGASCFGEVKQRAGQSKETIGLPTKAPAADLGCTGAHSPGSVPRTQYIQPGDTGLSHCKTRAWAHSGRAAGSHAQANRPGSETD
jgi:hypothetical protein